MKNTLFSGKEFIFGFLLWLLAAFFVAESRWSRLYQEPALSAEQAVDVYLPEDTDAAGLADVLADEYILVSREEFDWAAQTLHWNRFRAGRYELRQDISYEKLLSKIGKGLQDPMRVTILPGQSEARILRIIPGAFQFDSTVFKQTLADSSFLANAGTNAQELIGRLYPATYDFYWTADPETVVGRMLDTFNDNIISEYSQRFEELDKSVNEIITLASIIEWEAGRNDEKPTISGLYWNRLERGMRLQADPTVNFAVGQRRRLLYKDYEVDHPYNTYIHQGLPPGPITNPSKSSIEAALFPESHDYLYMVASPEGGHNFSETYREHQRKSAEWREWLEEQYRIKEERESNGLNE